MQQTLQQYDNIISQCREIYVKKTKDYGTSWRILRPKSITDQLFIKARRIRSIEESGEQKIADSVDGEFMGLINYCVIGLIQLDLDAQYTLELDAALATKLYNEKIDATRTLMMAKNHDYGEVWRDMRISSMTDLILQKLLRVKQIEDNKGATIISEGIDANYQDIINYSVFALILSK
jgi:hypothetical protein